jgi:hypothetical protein
MTEILSKAIFKDSIALSPHMAIAFEISGALLIQQIHYWNVTNGHLKEGHRWCYNTHEQWAEQLMVYGRTTIINKMKELEKLGIIIVGCFNKHGYDRTKWYRIDYDQLSKAIQAKFPGLKLLCLPQFKFCTIKSSKSGMTIPETPTKTPSKNLNSQTGLTVSKTPDSKDTSEDQEAMNKAHKMAMEVLEGIKNKKDEPLTVKTLNPTEISFLWARAVKRYHPNVKFVKPFTMVEISKLKYLIKVWGSASPKVLVHMIEHWIKFTNYAEAQYSAFKSPLIPTLAYVVRYPEAAANFYLTDTGSKKVAAKAVSVEKTESVESDDAVIVKNAVGVGVETKSVVEKGKTVEKKLLKSASEISCTTASDTGTESSEDEDEEDKPTTLEFLLKYKGSKNEHGKGKG